MYYNYKIESASTSKSLMEESIFLYSASNSRGLGYELFAIFVSSWMEINFL